MIRTCSILSFLLLAAALILNTACSSGGDSGTTTVNINTAPAAIDDTNAEAIGTSAGEGVQKAAASTNLPTAVEVSASSPDMDQINNTVISSFDLLNQPAAYDLSSICETGTVTSSNTTAAESGPYTSTITYTSCKLSSSDTTVNGIAIIHFDDIGDPEAGFYIVYEDFTVSSPTSGTTTINWSYSCSNLSDYLTCEYSSDFVGTDGVKSRMADFSIYGDATSGYSGTATFYHGTFGEVSITVTGITYGSCGSIPDGGHIEFSSTGGSSGTIIFNGDCTVSGTWTNGTTGGSFP